MGNFDALNSKVIPISSINPLGIDGLVKGRPTTVSRTQEHWVPPLHIKGPTYEVERGLARQRASHTESISVTHGYFRPDETQTVTHA